MSTKWRIVLIAAIVLVLAAVMMIPRAVSIRQQPNEVEGASDSQSYENPIDAIVGIAISKGINPEHLLAISAQESSLGKFLVGDHGCSRGWFHINLCANAAEHVIGDPATEAAWAADKLLAYGYAESSTLAIARYNSPAKPNYAYAERVLKRTLELDLFLAPYQDPPKP